MRKSHASEGLRVAQEVAAIRVALHECGYKTRKRPKQPVWNVYVTDKHWYLLTYQAAPISSWVLHPQNNHPDRRALLTIIQKALNRRPAGITAIVL